MSRIPHRELHLFEVAYGMNEPKRIVIDARMVQERGHGIGNYVRDLALGYLEIGKREDLPFELHFLLGASSPVGGVWESISHSRSAIEFMNRRESFQLQKEIKALSPDLFHSPSFVSLVSYPCAHIQTVHDLNHLYYGSVAQKIYYQFLLKRSLRGAKQIVTVSQTSRLELARWLGIDSNSVSVVPNAFNAGVYGSIGESVLADLGLETGKYFVSLATKKAHKNISMLVAAYQRYRELSEEKWPLLLSMNSKDFNFDSREGIVFLPNEFQENILGFIAAAGALCFPSLYEGFGRPPVEAISVGTPVIATNIPVVREVLGEIHSAEVQMIDPRDREGWTNAMMYREKLGRIAIEPKIQDRILEQWSLRKMWEAQKAVYLESIK